MITVLVQSLWLRPERKWYQRELRNKSWNESESLPKIADHQGLSKISLCLEGVVTPRLTTNDAKAGHHFWKAFAGVATRQTHLPKIALHDRGKNAARRSRSLPRRNPQVDWSHLAPKCWRIVYSRNPRRKFKKSAGFGKTSMNN